MTLKLVKSPQELRRLAEALHKPHDHASTHGGEPAVGDRDGLVVTTVPPRTSKAANRKLKAQQNPVVGRPVKLTERRAQAERPAKPLSPEDIGRLATSNGIPKGTITHAARRILDGEEPGLPDSPEGDKTRLLAYHLALQCLGPGTDRKARAALLSPVGPFTRQPRDIAEHFGSAYPDDAEGLEALIETIIEVKGEKDHSREARERHKADAERLRQRQRRGGDDEALEQLAEWMGIPSVDPDRDERREVQVRNALARFTTDNQHGQRALKGLNTDRVAGAVADRPRFEKTYIELSEAQSKEALTPVQALLLLVKAHEMAELGRVIDEQTRAASDDLNADNPSLEANRLFALVSQLGTLRVEKSIIPLFDRTGKRVDYAIQKSGGAPSAAAA